MREKKETVNKFWYCLKRNNQKLKKCDFFEKKKIAQLSLIVTNHTHIYIYITQHICTLHFTNVFLVVCYLSKRCLICWFASPARCLSLSVWRWWQRVATCFSGAYCLITHRTTHCSAKYTHCGQCGLYSTLCLIISCAFSLHLASLQTLCTV